MSLQGFIDAIDPTKPVNSSAGERPTLKSVRDNTAAIKAALQAIGDQAAGDRAAAQTVCLPMVFAGFNTDIAYWQGTAKVPNFVCSPDGNFYITGTK